MIFYPPTEIETPSRDILSWAYSFPSDDDNKPVFVNAANPDITLSRAEVKDLVSKLAGGFLHAGVRPGQCMFVHSRNDIHLVVVAFACVAIGAIYCPVPFYAQEDELVYSMSTAGADWIMVAPEGMKLVKSAAERAKVPANQIICFDSPGNDQVQQSGFTYRTLLQHGEAKWLSFDDMSRASQETILRMFTSGSTGLPKAVNLPHVNITHTMWAKMNWGEAKHYTKHVLHNIPLNHVTGWYSVAETLAGRGVMYLSRASNISSFIDECAKFQITDCTMSPKGISEACRLLEDGTKPRSSLASLKHIVSVGDLLQTGMKASLKALVGEHLCISSGYGSTEAGGMVSIPYPEEANAAASAIGPGYPNVKIKLFSVEKQEEVEDYDTLGEVCVQSPSLFTGYHNNPKATIEAFITDKDGKWYKTGDAGYIARDTKQWTLVGRAKDSFKLENGEQVVPAEVEEILFTHPLVMDAAIGAAHSSNDSIIGVKAWIHAKDASLTQDDVINFLRGKLADHKLPLSGVKFVSLIPRTPSGKLLRGKLDFI